MNLTAATNGWTRPRLWLQYDLDGDADPVEADARLLAENGYREIQRLHDGQGRLNVQFVRANRDAPIPLAQPLTAPRPPVSSEVPCRFCAWPIDRGDRFCRWCGSRLGSLPEFGEWTGARVDVVGFGACPLGLSDGLRDATSRRQHHDGRPFPTEAAARAHASWCRTFAGVPAPTTVEVEGELSRSAFKAQSELFQLGYQISDLTREERWEVIESRAVPFLGAGEVARAIESLIRLRSGQSRDYSNAIREWEFDLSRIRRRWGRG
jgi:hypothetical protein